MLMDSGLPSPISIPFSRLIPSLLLKVNKSLILYNYDEDHYNALNRRQNKRQEQ